MSVLSQGGYGHILSVVLLLSLHFEIGFWDNFIIAVEYIIEVGYTVSFHSYDTSNIVFLINCIKDKIPILNLFIAVRKNEILFSHILVGHLLIDGDWFKDPES